MVHTNEGTDTSKYGECSCCGQSLEPVWFTEEEYNNEYGHMYKTGRVRRAVDVLVCPFRLKEYCVDDTFDGPWYRPSI